MKRIFSALVPIFLFIISFTIVVSFNISDSSWHNFLQVLTTFYIAILAFMIPISIQMVLNLREAFPTKQIEDRFKREATYKLLPILLLVQIVFIGIFQLFKYDGIYFPIYLTVIFMFFVTSYLIYKYIIMLIRYTDKGFVIDSLVIDTKKYISNKKYIKESKTSIKSLGDILAKEINQTPNYDLVYKLFNNIKEICVFFIPKSDTYEQIEGQENIDYFYEITNSIQKAAEKSIVINNDDISQELQHLIYDIIYSIISMKNNEVYLSKFLKSHFKIFIASIESDCNYKDYFTYHWYTHFIFNEYDKEKNFNRKYLNMFDSQLFDYIKVIIDQKNKEVFKSFISWIHNGIGLLDDDSGLYSYYSSNNVEDDDFLIELNQKFNNIIDSERLEDFLKNFNEFKTKSNKAISSSDNLQIIEKEIVSKAYSKFFLNNLRDMIYGISAYCLYKKRYDFIKVIWEYKQPKDSTAQWLGHDIYPQNISKIIERYFYKSYRSKFYFIDGHSQSDIYEIGYELYLFGYLISEKKSNCNQFNSLFYNKSPKQLDLLKAPLKSLENEIDKVYNFKNIKIFKKIGFSQVDEQKIDHIKSEIKHLFSEIQNQIEDLLEKKEQTLNISQEKIDTFKREIQDNLEQSKSRSLRGLIKEYADYRRVNNYKEDKKPFGMVRLLPRAMFFKEWTTAFVNYENNISNSMINGEDREIIKKIIDNAKKISGDSIEKEALESFNNINDIFIISINNYLSSFNKESYFSNNKFFSKFQNEGKSNNNLDSLYGHLKFKETYIPVYGFRIDGVEKSILILNKNRFVNFTSYFPNARTQGFYDIRIEDSIKRLTDDEIKEKFKLSEDESEKINDYKKYLIFDFWQSFEIQLDSDFKGYIFYPNNLKLKH